MNKLIEWRGTLWSRFARNDTMVIEAPGAVLSRARARELEQPTYLRRGLAIDGVAAPAARSAAAPARC